MECSLSLAWLTVFARVFFDMLLFMHNHFPPVMQTRIFWHDSVIYSKEIVGMTQAYSQNVDGAL